jgi:hypothetical protein
MGDADSIKGGNLIYMPYTHNIHPHQRKRSPRCNLRPAAPPMVLPPPRHPPQPTTVLFRPRRRHGSLGQS